MAIFRIEERDPFEFWHYIGIEQITNFSEWEIVLEEVSQTINLQMLNGANYPKYQVPIADVRFRIEGGSDEAFTTVSLLRARLKARNYNPLLDPPEAEGIQSIVAGTNITVDNTDPQNPIVSSTGGGGREIKYHDTTTGNYTLITSDKNKIIILLEDNEIDIIVPASGFSDGDSVIIQNPNGTANANFDISGVQTYSDFSPLLPSYTVDITYALDIDAYGASYSTNGLESSGGGIPDAPNDANAYVRSGLAWVIGYTKSAIDTLLGNKQNTLTESVLGTFLNGLTAKNTLIDADLVSSVDTADSNKAKKTTWLNVWTNYLKPKIDAILVNKTDYASVTCWHLANTFSDGTSYFFGIINQVATTTSDARRRFFALLTGNIVTVHVITNATTPTSAQDVSLKINNITAGTSVTVGAIRFDNVAFVFNFTGLTFAVTENDVLEFELVVPVLTTNGTACTTTCQVTFKKS